MDCRVIELAEVAKGIIDHFDFEGNEYKKFLIFSENTRDPIILQTLASVARERGVDVTTMWIKEVGVGATEEPSAVLGGAMQNADAALGIVLYPLLYTKTIVKAMLDYGVKYLECNAMGSTVDCLLSPTSRYPLDVMYVIEAKLNKILHEGTTFRMKDEKGTDFTCEIPDGNFISPPRPPANMRGAFDMFPFGERCFWSYLTANGVICFDGFYKIGHVKSGIPIKCTIEGGWCTKIEGGPEADQLKSMLEGYENSYHCAEVAIGVNPHARINLSGDPTLIEAQRNIGVAHVALGDTGVFGGDITPGIHLDGTILEPTIWIDDKKIIDKGWSTILNDPDIVKAAKQHKRPERILKQTREIC